MPLQGRQFITGAVTQPCRYKGSLQSTNSGICFAQQVGLPVLKESIELAARRSAESLFQHLGPAAEKARSPNRVFIRLTRRSHLPVDRSLNPEADECVSLQYSRKYPGAAPLSDLYTSKQILNSTRRGTGSQCRTSWRSGVMWSYFLRLHSSLAAALRTDCRQSRRRLGAPTSRLLQRSTCDVTKAATAALAASKGKDLMQPFRRRS